MISLSPTPRRYPEILVVAACYFSTARLGLLLAIPGGHVTPVWPPSGIALAAVLLLGPRVVAGVFLGSFLANYWDFHGSPAGFATGLAISTVFGLGAMFTAQLGARLVHLAVGPGCPLTRVRDVCAFIGLGGMVSCLLSATIGVTTLCVSGNTPWAGYGHTWLTWWLGDTAGVFTFAPLLLVWLRPAPVGRTGGWAEAAACFVVLGIVTTGVFLMNRATFAENLPLAFLVFPFLIWPSIRFGQHGATAASALIALLAVRGTIDGSGPFRSAEQNTALLLLELFLGVVVLTALCLAAINSERRKAEAAQQRLMDELETRVRERTLELQRTNVKLETENTERARAEHAVQNLLKDTERARTTLLSLLEDQKAAELALRKSETQLRTNTHLLEATQAIAQLGGWEIDLPTQAVFCTPEAYRLLDTSPAEYSPTIETGVALFTSASRAVIMTALQAAMTEGENFDLELEMITFKGRRIDVRVTCNVTRHDDRPVKLLGTIQDITARKAAEAALRESEASLAAAQARARMGSWELFLSENTGTWSAEMFRLFDRDPALGTPPFGEFLDSILPDDRDKFQREFNEAMSQRNEFSQEFRIVRRDNSILWIEGRGTLIRDATGLPLRLVGTSQDITERKNAEAALRESEERFRQLTENIGEVFWITDAAKPRTLYVSPAYETIWGRSCRSLYDSPATWHEAIHPEDRERIRAATAKMALGTYDEEYRITRPDGTLRWIHDKAFPVRNEKGTVTRIVGVAEDTTEQRHLEAQLRQSQKMEAIGTLAGGIAHDFNNILGAVKGYAQLARADAPDRPDFQEHLDAVLQGTHRAADLVRQIITFSRQHDTQHSPVRLQTIVTEALTLLRATIPTTVEIKTIIEHHAPPVLADPTQIHQVVMNLCTNAWHAMKSRPGYLDVRVEAVALDAEFTQQHPELTPGRHVRLTVADTGCGMDQAILSRIFEPFFTTKGPGEGSGLGLAVVHGIMRSHHGAIIVHSEPNIGTTFHLYFPDYAGEKFAPEPTTLSRSPYGMGERILLVDDELPLVRLGTIILEKSGYTVQAFFSSREALAAYRAHPDNFDLVVSDLAMPEMSGLDFATELRRLRPTLPILLCSGYVDADTKQAVTSLGIQQVILKPFTVESLSLAVHQVLAGRSPT